MVMTEKENRKRSTLNVNGSKKGFEYSFERGQFMKIYNEFSVQMKIRKGLTDDGNDEHDRFAKQK